MSVRSSESTSPQPAQSDPALDAKQSAAAVGVSLVTFWRGVASGRLPSPVYPSPRTPRWFHSELREAVLATRALPSEQKDARRAARLKNAVAA